MNTSSVPRKKKFWIIDGSSLLHREYFASLPEEIKFAKTAEDKETQYWRLPQVDGHYVNAIEGFFSTVAAIVAFQRPDYFAIAFDEGRETFRREMFPQYKAQREPTPEPLKQQMQDAMDICNEMGIPCLHSKEYEADDYVGSLSKKFASPDVEVHLMTTDRDYLQLLDANVRAHMMITRAKYEALVEKYGEKKGPYGTYEYDVDICKNELGIRPDQITDWKGISGDVSDNIPGIPKVGEKTVIPLLAAYNSIEGIADYLSTHTDAEAKEEWKALGINRPPVTLIREGMSNAEFCKNLATIKTDIEVGELDDYVQNTNILDYKNLAERRCLMMVEDLIDRISEEFNNNEEIASEEESETLESEAEAVEEFEEDMDEYDNLFG